MPDFEALSKIAHDSRQTPIVDNTGRVGLVRPIGKGAYIVVASATKCIGGQGTSIGGIVLTGQLQWNKGKFSNFEPYTKLSWTQKLG